MRICVLLLAFGLVLSGCANLNSVRHNFKTGENDSLTIDAQQRAVYTVNKTFKGTGGVDRSWIAVCAEPSPDAISALSSNTGLDAAVLGKALGLALSTQQGVASIGLRTQSITLLRDAMYRLCEGYASGALDDIGFARLQRRYQNIMLGLLSIEQLTGAVVAHQATLGGSGGVKLGQSFGQLKVLIDEADGKATIAASQLKAGKAKFDTVAGEVASAKSVHEKALADAKGDEKDAEVVKAKTALDQKSALAATAKEEHESAIATDAKASADLKELKAFSKEVERASAFASIAGDFGAQNRGGLPLDPKTMDKVTTAVSGIVERIVDRDYTRETCLDTFLSRTARVLDDSDAFELAAQYCSYALQVDAIRPVGVDGTKDATQLSALATARATFDQAIQSFVTRRKAPAPPLAAPIK